MSITAGENRNYYNSEFYPCIEKAILAEDITFTSIDDIKGKFFIKVLTPQVDTNGSITKIIPRVSSNTNQNTNYVELRIPQYMLFQFMTPKIDSKGYMYFSLNKKKTFTIPKGTTFYVEFLGGDPLISKIIIIGLAGG
jgi:hypothetical protein